MSVPLVAEELALQAVSEPLRADWAALAAGSGPGGLLSAPSFVEAFSATFGDEVRTSLLAIRDAGGTLVGALPLARTRVRRGVSLAPRYAYIASDAAFLRTPGVSPIPIAQLSSPLALEATALRTEVLAAPGRKPEVLRALGASLRGLGDWSTAVFVLDEEEAAEAAATAPASRLHRLDRPMKFLMAPRPWEELLAAENKKFRQNIRRAEKFSEEAGVGFRHVTGAEVAPLMADFAALAERSWKQPSSGERAETEDVLVPYTVRQRRFMERLLSATDLEPSLFGAWIDGRLASAMVCATVGRVMTTLLIFTDAEAGRLTLGRLLLHRAIDEAAARKLDAIDWNSNASWTERYSNRTSVRHNLVVTAPTVGGALLRGIGRIADRVRGGPAA